MRLSRQGFPNTSARPHRASRTCRKAGESEFGGAGYDQCWGVSSRRLSGEVGSMRDGSWLGFRCLGRQRCQLRAGLLAQSGIGGGEAGYFAVARNQSGYSVDAPARFQRLRQLPRRPGPGRQRSGQAGKGREGGILGSKEFHQSPRPSPSRPYRRRHPDEQCRHLVGPIGCRSLRARSGRTPPSPALPITFTRMRASRTNALRSPLSAPHSWQITSAPRPRCRREAVDLPSCRAFLVVLRPMRLLAVRYLKRSSKRCWGWARQHRQRGDMLWIAVGEQPGEAATPIMANQMKRRLPCPVAATKWSAPPISRNGHRATVGSSRRSPGLTAGP